MANTDQPVLRAPEIFDTIVIGGGIMGVSAAYHLLLAGAGRVLLLEREPDLATRTTHGAAGFIAPWWLTSGAPEPELRIERYAMALYRDLATRHTIGLRAHGLAHIATTTASDAGLRRSALIARERLGADLVELLEPADLRELVPIVNPTQVGATLLVRDAFSLVAADAVRALAQEFVALGGAIRTGSAVEQILIDAGQARGVMTSAGPIHAEHVVVAAGAWLRQLAHHSGVPLPLLATQASRFVTQPLAAVPADMPMLMFPAYHNLYLRPEAGGLLIGCEEIVIHPPTLQGDMATLARGDVPARVAAGVSPVDDTTHHYHLWLARAFARVVPLLAEIAVREVRVGYPTRVPDMRHICGPAAGIGGLYLLGADLECGMTHGPGLGKMLADQISKAPDADATTVYAATRFGEAG